MSRKRCPIAASAADLAFASGAGDCAEPAAGFQSEGLGVGADRFDGAA